MRRALLVAAALLTAPAAHAQPQPIPEVGGSSGGESGSAVKDPKKAFAGTCGSCHTLKAAGTSGATGPNLDELKPDLERVKTAIAEGPSIMPADLYKGADADAIATFVSQNAGK